MECLRVISIRDIIRRCVNASEEDAVIFAGSGANDVIENLVHVMQEGDTNPTVGAPPSSYWLF